jgi:cleavage and polyadenylation specificity factor subunit 4
MKGDECGFLHEFDPSRMPVCRNLIKHGECRETNCPFKHNVEEVKECNMYKLGFCIYGPTCRYRHVFARGEGRRCRVVALARRGPGAGGGRGRPGCSRMQRGE